VTGSNRKQFFRLTVSNLTRVLFYRMYLIKQTPSSPRKLEMSFDCTAFQHQFPDDLPMDKRVFQTIFLNKKDKDEWSLNEIDKSKISKYSLL